MNSALDRNRIKTKLSTRNFGLLNLHDLTPFLTTLIHDHIINHSFLLNHVFHVFKTHKLYSDIQRLVIYNLSHITSCFACRIAMFLDLKNVHKLILSQFVCHTL